MSEGVIKYNITWHKKPVAIPGELLQVLLNWRDICYRLKMIGVYNDGTAYGNLSARLPGHNEFYITGTGTGGLKVIHEHHLVRVDQYNLSGNWVECTGEIKASAESLSHAAIYQSDNTVCGVIHVHHRQYWEQILQRVPTTAAEAVYGTPEMAEEIARLFRDTALRKKKIVAMAGHPEGFLTFGENLDEAGAILLAVINSSA